MKMIGNHLRILNWEAMGSEINFKNITLNKVWVRDNSSSKEITYGNIITVQWKYQIQGEGMKELD